jgi:hypothetical protein
LTESQQATVRRWRNFGKWCEADLGRKQLRSGMMLTNPNQLLINEKNKQGLAELRDALQSAHLEVSMHNDLLVGLQLTHSGRFSR